MLPLESFVTIVTCDETGWKALVLAKSIRRFHPLRKLTVLYDESNISKEMGFLLDMEFDMVQSLQHLNEIYCSGSLEIHMSKILLWSLLSWDKCIYISPDSLVTESLEELFELTEFSAPAQPTDSENERWIPSMDVFVFQPNISTLKKLTAGKTKIKDCSELLLKFFWKNWSETSSNQIRDGFLISDFPTQHHLHFPKPKIVKFTTQPWGNLETKWTEEVASEWLEIFHQKLVPDVLQKSGMQEFINDFTKEFAIPKTPIHNQHEATLPDFGEYADAIAVVGMSCRFPGANNVDEFWDILKEGKSQIRKFPNGRRTFDIPGIENLEAGFLKCPIDAFDGKFFGISPREAPLVDPQQRLLLEVIWESLEDAGISGTSIRNSSTGVFVGIYGQDYDRLLPKNGYIGNEYHHRFLGNAGSANIGRISYFMGFTGPNVAIDSGSASSLGALHLAVQCLNRRESNLVITGGVHLVLLPRNHNPMTSDDAGWAESEGVGILILKRFVDAVNDGDNIRALIRGTAFQNGGKLKQQGSFEHPDWVRVMKCTLENANVNPNEIDYVEMDGTGLPQDEAEFSALKEIYNVPHRPKPLRIGCIKSILGRGESVSPGIAGIFKIILALERQVIPDSMVYGSISRECTPWTAKKRLGSINSSNLMGGLAQVILESAPEYFRNSSNTLQPEVPQLITIAGKSIEALEAQCTQYLAWCEKNPDVPMNEFARATNLSRSHFQHRIAIPALNMADLITKLKMRDFQISKMSSSKDRSVGFLFTGQGSQYYGMGRELYSIFSAFKVTFDICSNYYREETGLSLNEVLWKDEAAFVAKNSEIGQAAILAIQISLISLWRHFGIVPNVVLGHSVGEYAAAVCANVISIREAFRLVTERSRLVSKLPIGGMSAVKASVDHVQTILYEMGSQLDIAAINSVTEVVVSGSPDELGAFENLCLEKSIKTHRLSPSVAFHSRQIDQILDDFGLVMDEIEFNPPTCSYISSTMGREMGADEFTSEYWQYHMRDAVQFSTALGEITKKCRTLIEIGPHPVLLGITKSTFPEADLVLCPSMRKKEDNWYTFWASMAKIHVDGTLSIDLSAWFGRTRKIHGLPLYPFQRSSHWFVLSEYVTTEEDEIEKVGDHFRSARIHPILGHKVPTESMDMIFAQAQIIKGLPYLKDVVFRGKFILPPGAIIELFLAAANQIPTQINHEGFELTNLEFKNYILLAAASNIETVLASQTPGASEAILYKNNLESNRAEIARVQIHPYSQLHSEMRDTVNDVSKGTVVPLGEIYSETTDGICFGRNYQKIRQLWKFDGNTILARLGCGIQDPQEFGTYSYVSFPPFLDAMIHVGKFASGIPPGSLPINISSVTWSAISAQMDNLWVYAKGDTVTLFAEQDGASKVLAEMKVLKFSTTFDGLVEEAIQATPKISYEDETDFLDLTDVREVENEQQKILAEIVGLPVASENLEELEKTKLVSPLDQNEDASNNLLDTLEAILRETTRLPVSEVLDVDMNFSEIGVDSLMGLEIGAKLQKLLPHKGLSAIVVQEHPTMRQLLLHLESD